MLFIKLKIFCPTHNMLGNVLSSFDVKFVKFFLYPLGRSCIFYFNFSMLIALIMLTDSWMLIMYALDKHFCYSLYLLFNSLRLFYGCMCVLKRCSLLHLQFSFLVPPWCSWMFEKCLPHRMSWQVFSSLPLFWKSL